MRFCEFRMAWIRRFVVSMLLPSGLFLLAGQLVYSTCMRSDERWNKSQEFRASQVPLGLICHLEVAVLLDYAGLPDKYTH